jgi:hypothetical protein
MRSSRDRDRLRGEQLGRLGWMHVRVWSTDLFRDPARDVARVNAAVQQAVASRAAAVPVADEPTAPPEPAAEPAVPEPSAPGPGSGAAPSLFDDVPAEEIPETEGPGADEFVPTTDQGARERRVRGRKAKRVIAPATSEQPDAPMLDVPTVQTKDDTDAGWGESQDESAHDRWLREQRPPHWGSD